MSFIINSNGFQAQTASYLKHNFSRLNTSLARLGSGDRIVKIQDDSAAISVSKKISSAITRNKRVQEIAGNAIGFLKLQQGALQEIQKTIDRMSELKAMSVDVTQNANDINNYNAEFHELQQHLRGVRDLKFNSTNVFVTEGRDIQMLSTEVGEQGDTQIDRVYVSGNAGDKLTLKVDGSNFTFDIGTATEIQDDINASNLGDIFLAKNADDGNGFFELEAKKYNNRYSLNAEYSVSGSAAASVNSATIQKSSIVHVNLSREGVFRTDTPGGGLVAENGSDLLDITKTLADYDVSDFINYTQNTSTAQADNGAEISRLMASNLVLESNFGNLRGAVSRLNDVDYAKETTAMAKWNILYKSSTSMLAQANTNPQLAMTLLA